MASLIHMNSCELMQFKWVRSYQCSNIKLYELQKIPLYWNFYNYNFMTLLMDEWIQFLEMQFSFMNYRNWISLRFIFKKWHLRTWIWIYHFYTSKLAHILVLILMLSCQQCAHVMSLHEWGYALGGRGLNEINFHLAV